MTSLKAYIPRLSSWLGLSRDALYERQRTLVRSGYLSPTAGRGPGSGVRVSSDTVASLLIAVLATDNLSEVGERTRSLAGARVGARECKLTGAKNFKDALSTILFPNGLVQLVTKIQVERRDLSADIWWLRKGTETSDFSSFGREPFDDIYIQMDVMAVLSGALLKAISKDLEDISLGNELAPVDNILKF